jgi:hypothetical protein
MLGVTLNEVALAVAQEKFTNCPGPTTIGETAKLLTAGAVELPVPPPLLLPPELELLDPPPHPAAIKSESRLSRETAQRNRDIVAGTFL